jgi:hypothetical protein
MRAASVGIGGAVVNSIQCAQIPAGTGPKLLKKRMLFWQKGPLPIG